MARTGPEAPIEFLDPDERAFGASTTVDFRGFDDGADPFSDDPPRPRGSMIAAVAIVVAVIAAVVLVAQPWNGSRDSTAVPPVTGPVTVPVTVPVTAPATAAPPTISQDGATQDGVTQDGVTQDDATQEAASIEGVYVLDGAPPGWELTGSAPGFDSSQPMGWGEVWAVDGSTRTTGRWFAVTLLPFQPAQPSGPSAVEVDVNGTLAQLVEARDGVTTIQFDRGQPDADRLVVISGFGVDVTAVARSLGIADDRPQLVDDRPVIRDPALVDGFTRVAAGPTRQQLIDRVLFPDPLTAFSIYRRSPDTDRGSVVIQSSPDIDTDAALEPLASVRIGQLPGTWRVPADFRGADLSLSTREYGGDTLRIARWRTGGVRITMITDRPFSELLELLPLVQPRA